jgi:hypothetical protein
MYEIFGLKLNLGYYIVLFVVCQFINVALNTAKTIIMHKEEKISSAIINAVTYGFYSIIVVMTASALPLWITIVISALTNLIGVYGSMWLLERFKKDSLWEIVANITVNDNEYERFQNTLCACDIPYNLMKLYGENIADGKLHLTATMYSKSQRESAIIKELLDSFETKSKYIVHEERVRL